MKIAIVGMASGYERAPYHDPSWNIWLLNDAYRLWTDIPRVTAWWELHGDTPLTRARRPAGHFERLKAVGVPVYYLHGDAPVPNARRLDVDTLATVGRDYFACTMAYQIAEALRLGATAIGLFGAPLQSAREALVERPCVAWWLGLAEGRGVRVTVDHGYAMGLLRHPYRYAEQDLTERQMVYWAARELQASLDGWLPHEEDRLWPGMTPQVEHAG